MRKLLMIGAIAVGLALPTASRAQFTLGARLGYAPAMGDFSKDNPQKDLVKSQIPIQVDGLYRFTPEIAAGLYFSYGIGQLNSDVSDQCDATGIDCSVSAMRLGLQGTYSLTKVSPTIVPWLGAGIGFEWLSVKQSLGGFSATADTTGFEFLNLQGGADYKVAEKFALGPYVLFSIGQYSSVEGNSITDKGIHEWLHFGIRGKFDL